MKSRLRSEVEFLVPRGADVIPLEVKSGKITKAQSLQKYIEKYNAKESIILSGQFGKILAKQGIYRLPLYLADRLNKLIMTE